MIDCTFGEINLPGKITVIGAGKRANGRRMRWFVTEALTKAMGGRRGARKLFDVMKANQRRGHAHRKGFFWQNNNMNTPKPKESADLPQ